MTWDEFTLMPRKLGWKHEYFDGMAHITPGHTVVSASVPVRPRTFQAPCLMRALAPGDEPLLIAPYVAAFSDSMDYCDWEPERIDRSARESLRDYFAGNRGRPLAASRAALDPQAQGTEIVGAALLVEGKQGGPLLDLLFVSPPWHRKGVATALVSAAVNALHEAGETTLQSRYLLGNEQSRAWHRAFGFTEEPDFLLANVYYRHAEHELRRRERIGDLTEHERTGLVAERDRYKALVRELEAALRASVRGG
jgi:GNAT superfamily N-acetyltransferase